MGRLQVGLLFAAVRLLWLAVTTIIALSRLDACLFTMYKGNDRGYASFLAMAVMLHAFQVQPPLAMLRMHALCWRLVLLP